MTKNIKQKTKKNKKGYLLIALFAVIIILLGLEFVKATKNIYKIEDRKQELTKAKKA